MYGNLEYAAEVALKCGRVAEALLIAQSGGDDLLQDIQNRFFASNKDPFVKEVI